MRQVTSVRSNVTISKRQQRLMSILSGLVLALGQCAFLYLNITFFQSGPLTLIGLWILLAFIAAIPPGFYIARQTGERHAGLVAGRITGCTAALLTTLGAAVYMLILIIIPSPDLPLIIVFFFMIICINIIGTLAAFAGAFVGSRFGSPL